MQAQRPRPPRPPQRTGCLCVLFCGLFFRASLAHADQLVLVDIDYTHSSETTRDSHYYPKLPDATPADWTSPVDYAHGSVHLELDVKTKPEGGAPTKYQLCFEATPDVACTLQSPTYTSTGHVVWDSPFDSFWYGGTVDWSQGVRQIPLILKDDKNNKPSGDPAYMPTDLHVLVVLVSAGSTYVPVAAAGSGGMGGVGAGVAGTGGTSEATEAQVAGTSGAGTAGAGADTRIGELATAGAAAGADGEAGVGGVASSSAAQQDAGAAGNAGLTGAGGSGALAGAVMVEQDGPAASSTGAGAAADHAASSGAGADAMPPSAALESGADDSAFTGSGCSSAGAARGCGWSVVLGLVWCWRRRSRNAAR